MNGTKENKFLRILSDIAVCLIAAALVACSLYYFSNFNHFAPGGVTGLASMIGYISGVNMGVFMLLFNLPLFILVVVFVSKKTGVYMIIYMVAQSLIVMLLEKVHCPYYAAYASDPAFVDGNNLIFAAIGVGVISGFGFSCMLKRFGASGGTYAISALVKHFKPASSIAWLSFVLDGSVVFLAFFIYDSGVNAVIGTLLNIFIANAVVDFVLRGTKRGYKFEIVIDDPVALGEEIMEKLHRGVTSVQVQGMHSHTGKYLLICVIRKRQLGEFMKIVKKHNGTFSYFAPVNEVFGNFLK